MICLQLLGAAKSRRNPFLFSLSPFLFTVDAASAEPDSLKRIAYVAAFAMSNYSSTSGRIGKFCASQSVARASLTLPRLPPAKPFNPMLGETFEYARLDKKFRYVSEQVCHHPVRTAHLSPVVFRATFADPGFCPFQPISACWSESPHFRYYGEVDAKNKFLGRSFEIRPTGVAHVDLRIPSSFAKGKDYPEDPTYASAGQDGVLEHYS